MTTNIKTEKPKFSLLDFGRNTKARSSHEHPLVAASAALQEGMVQKTRTGNLVGILLAQASRARRKGRPAARVRIQVFGPQGSVAARLRLPA